MRAVQRLIHFESSYQASRPRTTVILPRVQGDFKAPWESPARPNADQLTGPYGRTFRCFGPVDWVAFGEHFCWNDGEQQCSAPVYAHLAEIVCSTSRWERGDGAAVSDFSWRSLNIRFELLTSPLGS